MKLEPEGGGHEQALQGAAALEEALRQEGVGVQEQEEGPLLERSG